MKTAYEIELNVFRTCVEEIAAITNENIRELTYALGHFDKKAESRICERKQTIEENMQKVETDGFRIVVDHSPVNSDLRLIFVLVLISKGFAMVNDIIKNVAKHVMEGNGSGVVPCEEELIKTCESIGHLGENVLKALSQENVKLAQQLFENTEIEQYIKAFYEQKRHLLEQGCVNFDKEFTNIRVACKLEEIIRLLKSNSKELIYMVAGDGIPAESSCAEVTLD